MNPQRVIALILTAAGLALAASYLWLSNLVLTLAGAFITGLAISWLTGARQSNSHRRQTSVIQHLWQTARHIPRDRVMVDPITRSRFTVERARGFLALAVADPPHLDDPAADREALVTRYMLGFGRRPLPPPLFRHITPIDETASPLTWRQARQALRLADQTGAADTDTFELDDLRARLDRAVHNSSSQ